MNITWDESFFEHGQIEQPTYWVCFWTEVDGSTARVESRESGWIERKQLVRLAGNFRPE